MNLIDCPHCGATEQPEHHCSYCQGAPTQKAEAIEKPILFWSTNPRVNAKINETFRFAVLIVSVWGIMKIIMPLLLM